MKLTARGGYTGALQIACQAWRIMLIAASRGSTGEESPWVRHRPMR